MNTRIAKEIILCLLPGKKQSSLLIIIFNSYILEDNMHRYDPGYYNDRYYEPEDDEDYDEDEELTEDDGEIYEDEDN